MKVSFIVPIYNAQLYLESCVRSIMRQSYKDIQIILVNDGSTDESLQICYKLRDADERITVISQKNSGVSMARNVGITYATGEWIAFVDADDCISEDYVEIFEEYLNKDFDFVCGDEASRKKRKEISIKLMGREQFALYERGLLNKYAVLKGPHLTSVCGKLYRASFLKENKVFFPVCLKKSEDALFNQYVFHYARKGVYINKSVYDYRQYEKSASNKYDASSLNNYKMHLELLEQFLKREKIFAEMAMDYQIRVIFHFFYCVATDFCHKDNPHNYRERKESFIQGREAMPFASGFENAKASQLSLKEKALFYCIKYRCFLIVDAMFKVKRLIGARR